MSGGETGSECLLMQTPKPTSGTLPYKPHNGVITSTFPPKNMDVFIIHNSNITAVTFKQILHDAV